MSTALAVCVCVCVCVCVRARTLAGAWGVNQLPWVGVLFRVASGNFLCPYLARGASLISAVSLQKGTSPILEGCTLMT